MKRNPKTIIIAVLAVIIFLGAVYLLQFASNRNTDGTSSTTGTITTHVVPTENTKIVINGKNVEEGVITLKPGSYTVTVSHDSFETVSKQAIVTAGENTDIAVDLVSSSSSATNWYETHPSDGKKSEEIGGIESRDSAAAQRASLPFISELPFTAYGQYSIDYGESVKSPNDSTKVAIFISYVTESDKQLALNWIKYRGYDPAQLEIIYTQGLAQ